MDPLPFRTNVLTACKIDPEKLPDCVVCYVDSTIALPLIAAYVQARCKPRKPRRLYKRYIVRDIPHLGKAAVRSVRERQR